MIADAGEAEKDPHRRAILDNFLRHAGLEFSGQDEKILTPAMTVEQPVYHVKWGPDLATYEGMDAVQGYYNAVNEVVSTFQDHTCWVNDWGIASYSKFVRFTTGRVLAGEGADLPADDRTYAQLLPMAMFWKYDENAKLVGEDVFMLTDPTYEEIAEGEMFEVADLHAVARSFLRD
ncbi:hypothetical protein ACL02T_33370 [Pseudonocardia sp. RS010]|uniref:hypothetical protein n=1 Tax=Pseudonocardia sp. RS010 TaxID=3385979 RepID=UPI0039A1A414